MVGAREMVASIARSENRVAVLRALATEPRTRRALVDHVGIPASSLSRVLRELTDEYRLVERCGDQYRLTTAGQLVLDQYEALTETIEAVRTLGDALDTLSIETLPIDARDFHDAELVTGTEFDPTAAIEYGIERVDRSDSLRCVAATVPAPFVRAAHEEVLSDGTGFKAVLNAAYIEAVEGSSVEPLWRDLAHETAVKCTDLDLDCSLVLLDDVVLIWVCSDAGEQMGLIESDNPAVLEWAEDVFESTYRDAVPATHVLTG